MKSILLTVQSNGSGGWRLGLNKNDSIKYFSHLETIQFVLTDELILFCNAVCGTSQKKAFDFNNVKLSKWIIENSFQDYPNRKPTKLIFILNVAKSRKVLIFERVITIP